jgi:hypothetical protein
LFVLAFAAFGAATCFGFGVELAKLLEAVSVFAMARHLGSGSGTGIGGPEIVPIINFQVVDSR